MTEEAGSESASTADSEPVNGNVNSETGPSDKASESDDRTNEDRTISEEASEPMEPTPQEEVTSPIEHVEHVEQTEDDQENGTETESEPKHETFVMVDKEDIPAEAASPIAAEEADDMAPETTETEPAKEPEQLNESQNSNEATEEPEALPDFEEENDDPDALQLDANVDMDDDLNKVQRNKVENVLFNIPVPCETITD